MAVIATLCYLREVYLCSQYVPTGDKLFDRYAQAVVDRQRWRLFSAASSNPAVLPSQVLERWEPEFSADPRYWQLRYWNEANRGGRFEFSAERYESCKSRCRLQLNKARDLGISDPALCLIRFHDLLADLKRDSLDKSSIEKEIQLTLAEWKLAAPESSWPHCATAVWSLKRKDYSAAALQIKAFKATPGDRIPDLFPNDFVLKQMQQVHPMDYGNRLVYGSVWSSNTSSPVVSWSDIRNNNAGFIRWMGEHRDWDALNSWYHLGCRLGRHQETSSMQVLLGLEIAQTSLYSTLHYRDDLSQPERLILLAAVDRVARLKAGLGEFMGEIGAELGYIESWNMTSGITMEMPWISPRVEFFPVAIGKHYLYGFTATGMRHYSNLAMSEMENRSWQTVTPLSQLNEIDLVNPSIPMDWFDRYADASGFPPWHPDSEWAKEREKWLRMHPDW